MFAISQGNRRSLAWLAVLASLAAGCGDSGPGLTSSATNPNGTSAPQIVNPASSISGEFRLGRFVSGGTARLETLDGTVLAQSPVGATGNFVFPALQLPPDFRVRAIPSGTNLSFFTEVRGYRGQGRSVRVNVPTSLVSLYLQGHPGEDLAVVEAKVSRLLGLEANTCLEHGLSETARSRFSHLDFFVKASRLGGWNAVAHQQIAQLEALATPDLPPFFIQPSDFSASLAGLETGLANHIQPLQTSEAFALSEKAGDRLFSVLGFVGEKIGGPLQTQATKVAWTHLAESLGLNYGTEVALDAVRQQLATINSQLAGIQVDITTADYTSAQGALEPAISYLQTLSTTTLQAAVTQAGTEHLPSDQPQAAPASTGSIGKLLGDIAAFQTKVDLQLIQDYQLPGNNVVNMNLLSRQLNVDNLLAVQADNRFMGFPLRSNTLLDQGMKNYHFYKGYQEIAGNWLAENARQGLDAAREINGVSSELRTLGATLKLEREQFPKYLPSDEVIVDLQYGVMWYATMQSPMVRNDAKTTAENLKVCGLALGQPVVWDDWRLPCYNELLSLQNRGRFYNATPSTPGASYGQVSTATAGLEGLSFLGVNEAFTSADNDGQAANGGLWFESYTLGDGFWADEGIAEDELNHQQTIKRPDESQKRPFLLCRSIQKPLLNAEDPSQPNQDPTAKVSTYPTQMQPNEVQTGEYPSLGVLTGFKLVGAISHSQVTVDQLYTIYLGGDFLTGGGAASQHQSVASNKLVSPSIHPYSGTINQNPQFNELIMVPAYSTDNPLVEVSNYPPATFPTSSDPVLFNLFGSSGFMLKHTDSDAVQTVTLTATALGYQETSDSFPALISASGDISQPGIQTTGPSGVPRQPYLLQVGPQNRLYNSNSPASILKNGVIEEHYSASLFFDNLTVASKTSEVEWELLDANDRPFAASYVRLGRRFGPDPGLLQINLNELPESINLTVRASLRVGGTVYFYNSKLTATPII